jgi:hypothetical protein
VIRLCLDNYAVFNPRCAYRHRIHEGGYGWNISLRELGDACRGLIAFLDQDATVRRFAAAQPEEWRRLRSCLSRMVWGTYFWRWRDVYRTRMSGIQWVLAAFAMPRSEGYSRRVLSVLKDAAKSRVGRLFGQAEPQQEDFFKKGVCSWSVWRRSELLRFRRVPRKPKTNLRGLGKIKKPSPCGSGRGKRWVADGR